MTSLQIPQPVVVKILTRPEFNNAHLGDRRKWTKDNLILLSRFFRDCGRAIGVTDDGDLDIWLRCQHDIELHRALTAGEM